LKDIVLFALFIDRISFLVFHVFLISFLYQCSATNTNGNIFKKVDQPKMESSLHEFMGTPYKWGGNLPKSGVDCSGLTCSVYEDQGVLLPRTSRMQYTVGDKVRRNNLKYGDLVFYDTLGKGVSHVGIYVGNNKMIHAGTSKGVVKVDITTDYWKNKYIGARRLAGSPLKTGETQFERVIMSSAYLMPIRRLVNVPTGEIVENRFLAIDVQNYLGGDFRAGISASYWNRVEAGFEIQINQFLGSEAPSFEIPFVYGKVQLYEQKRNIPSIAIGSESLSRKWNVSYSDSLADTSRTETQWSAPKNAYVVIGYSYDRLEPTRLKGGRVTAGLTYTNLYGFYESSHAFDIKSDYYGFIGWEQHLTKRLISIMEIDHIGFDEWGMTWNAGFRLALNKSSSIEYTWLGIGHETHDTNRAMRFSYLIEY
jgi:hypothetical protein